MDREFALVLFGATGFTGRLVARYLARTKALPPERWALAGRDERKLQALREELLAIDPRLTKLSLLRARTEDAQSLAEIAKRTSVLLTTVGPFALYGEPVVAACLSEGTDYADLTGEPGYVRRLIERYHDAAKERGVRIVPACGFDSIPADLGVLFTLQQLPVGVPRTIEAFFRARMDISGGTWHSGLLAARSASQLFSDGRALADLEPHAGRTLENRFGAPRWDSRMVGWTAAMPALDPFLVLRSAALDASYGESFTYEQRFHWHSMVPMLGLGAGMAALSLAVRVPGLADRLAALRPSGDGPPEEERSRFWFSLTFLARAGNVSLRTRVSGGDPGYDETAKMFGETGLCLAFDRAQTPARAGVLTPATAMGAPLLDRLKKAGLRFETLAS